MLLKKKTKICLLITSLILFFLIIKDSSILQSYFSYLSSIFHTHWKTLSPIHLFSGIIAAIAAMVIEHLTIKDKQSSLSRFMNMSISLKADLTVFLLDVTSIWLLLGKVITLGITFFSASEIYAFISQNFSIKLIPLIEYQVIQVAVVMILSDFVGYWLHRFFHKIPSFWALHEFHHSANEFCVLTARRDHPLVVPFFILITGLPTALLGSPTANFHIANFLLMFHAFLIHSKISSDWGVIGRWFVVSPKYHYIHHSASHEHFDKNFSFLLPIWDHLFGSYCNGKIQPKSIGIHDKFYTNNNLYQCIIHGATKFFNFLSKKST